MKSFKDIKWEHFISRPIRGFLSIVAGNKYENEIMHKVLGFGYRNMCIFSNGNVIESYVDGEQRQAGYHWLAVQLNKNPKRISKLLNIAVTKRTMARNYIKKFNCDNINKNNIKEKYKEFICIFYEYMTSVVAIPFFILDALPIIEKDVKDKKILATVKQRCDKFREESLYPTFVSELLPSLERWLAVFLGVKPQQLRRLLPEEIMGILKKKDQEKVIKLSEQRKKDFSFLFINFKLVPSDYREVIEFFDRDVSSISSINGMPAFMGNVKGKVKIVIDKSDFYKFKEGDILITINSNPSFLPVINKCAGIVTDEGGLSCHAVIVSRELKKPCIVGTKIATKVLKDGDIVEVDAERGVVKIIR